MFAVYFRKFRTEQKYFGLYPVALLHINRFCFFDLKLCRFFTRRRWNRLEFTVLHAEIIKRVLFASAHFADTILRVDFRIRNQIQNPAHVYIECAFIDVQNGYVFCCPFLNVRYFLPVNFAVISGTKFESASKIHFDTKKRSKSFVE